MKKILFISFLAVGVAPHVFAQEVTEAEQKSAMAYLEKTQLLISGWQRTLLDANTAVITQPTAAIELQQQLLEKGRKSTKDFEALPALKRDEGLKAATIAYAKAFDNILAKNADGSYITAGNAAMNCEKCLAALKHAYQAQQTDIGNADVLMAKMSEAWDKVAKAYNIDFAAEDDAKAVKMRKAVDYVAFIAIAVADAAQAYKLTGQNLQKVLSNQLSLPEFEAMLPDLGKKLEAAQRFLKNDVKPDFEGNSTVYDAADKFLASLAEAYHQSMPQVLKLFSQEKLDDSQKKQAEQLLKSLQAPALLAQTLQQTSLDFLSGAMGR